MTSTTDAEVFDVVDLAERWATEQRVRTGRRVIRAGLPRIAGSRAAIAMRGDEDFDLLCSKRGQWTVDGPSDDRATTFAFLSGWYSLGSQSFVLPTDPAAEAWVLAETDSATAMLVARHRGTPPTSISLPTRSAVGFVGEQSLWLVLDKTRSGYTLRASAGHLTPDVLLHGLAQRPPEDDWERATRPVLATTDPIDVATIESDAPDAKDLLAHVQASVAKTAVPGVAPAELAAAVVSGIAQAIAGRPVPSGQDKPIDWAAIVRALGLSPDSKP